jgi:hypothetical protein
MGKEFDKNVAEVGDLPVSPCWKHTSNKVEQPRADAREILVGVV